MKYISFILVILGLSIYGQVIDGRGGKFGPGRIVVVDNCTLYKDGNTNSITGSDYNFKHWWASRIDVSDSYDACHFTMVLSQTGSPTGLVSLALYSDNSGSPGTLLVESLPLTNTQISVAAATNVFPGISWKMTNGTTVWGAVHFTDTVSIGETMNRYNIHNHFTGVSPDAIWISDNGTAWGNGGNKAFLGFQIRTTQ